jgi:hypothetical protein
MSSPQRLRSGEMCRPNRFGSTVLTSQQVLSNDFKFATKRRLTQLAFRRTVIPTAALPGTRMKILEGLRDVGPG